LARKKLSRHELKEDTFVSNVLRAWEFIRHNQNRFFAGLLVLVVMIAGAVWISNSRGHTEENARTQFAEALAAFRQGELSTAEEMFRVVNDRFHGLEEGAYSAYFAGKCALERGRNANAVEMFEEYLESAGKFPFFRDAALEGMAVAFENERDYERASEVYLRLASSMETNSFMEASYLRKAADTLKLSEQRDKAIEVLERLHELSSGTERRDIEIELDILRG